MDFLGLLELLRYHATPSRPRPGETPASITHYGGNHAETDRQSDGVRDACPACGRFGGGELVARALDPASEGGAVAAGRPQTTERTGRGRNSSA